MSDEFFATTVFTSQVPFHRTATSEKWRPHTERITVPVKTMTTAIVMTMALVTAGSTAAITPTTVRAPPASRAFTQDMRATPSDHRLVYLFTVMKRVRDEAKALGDDWGSPPSDEVMLQAEEWGAAILNQVDLRGLQWTAPHLQASPTGELAFEWTRLPRKLKLTFDGDQVHFLKSWGPHIVRQMRDGFTESPVQWVNLWEWLQSRRSIA